jgi:uroporphyrin-III C-methyltransferase
MLPEPGKVWLVGAGPGAADLMTVRAARLVEGAQALLYDALVEPQVLAMAPAACLRIQTGKRAGKTSMSQDVINRLMLRLARQGLNVVRLKGGDPSVFGRVGEEREFLEAHGVSVETVPGVTAASAAAAQFGFALTHRGEARRALFVTARVRDGEIVEDWSACADRETTVCVYMGRDVAGAVSRKLMALGRAAATPVAVVENAGRPGARVIGASLTGLEEALATFGGEAPVVLVIGEVARRLAIPNVVIPGLVPGTHRVAAR